MAIKFNVLDIEFKGERTEHKIDDKNSKILFGFNDGFKAPHSRHTTVYKEDIEKVPGLEIVSESDKAGVFIVENKEKNQLFVTGHLEYAVDTLDKDCLLYTSDAADD